ncbi:cysteine desulfurase [Patescibacteria group bacterium]|nr:cysteine desulfurase [Patescibacteria group bacterium]
MLDAHKIKKDFPIFRQKFSGQPLVYLDSTASSQKPQAVIDAVSECYEKYYANVHRGIYQLSELASDAYEASRATVAKFIGATIREIIFTRNATESLNLIAFTWGKQNISEGDEIIITEMEHHANIVPWQQLTAEKKAKLHYWPITDEGRLDLDKLDALLNGRTKLVSLSHMSNVLGTINPVKDIIKKIRKYRSDIVISIDGAQSLPHIPVNVVDIDADFYSFSSHKMLGPAGVGVLYGKAEILESMPPFLTGGDMITKVTFEGAEWNDIPFKFEAGTPNIAGVIGLAAAINYLEDLGMDNVYQHEQDLTAKVFSELLKIDGLKLFGPKDIKDRGAIFSFTLGDIHPHDLASILDEQGVAIRAGHHCAQPLHQRFGIEATGRASFYIYNTDEDIKSLIEGLKKAQELFSL